MTSKEAEARELARKHYEIESGMIQIFRVSASPNVESQPGEPIKLLEVNENTVASGILPLRFGPSPASGLNYSTIIMEVTPAEFQKIQDRQWELPHGWTIGDPIPKPDAGRER